MKLDVATLGMLEGGGGGGRDGVGILETEYNFASALSVAS